MNPTPPFRAFVWAAALICLFFPRSAFALGSEAALSQYVHDVWQRREGLPSSTVQAIAQTSDGYLWLGTAAGLVRFDGHTFTSVAINANNIDRHEPIAALVAGPDNVLWVGTATDGLHRLQNGTAQRVELGSGELNVARIYLDESGSVYAATPTGIFIRRPNGAIEHITTVHPYVTGIIGLPGGDLAVTTHAGLEHVSHGSSKLVDGLIAKIPPSGLMLDSKGNIWISCTRGIFVGQETALRHFGADLRFFGEEITTIFEDHQQNIWIATLDGLHRLRDGVPAPLRDADRIPLPGVQAMFEDREGSLWIGTSSGLHRLREPSITHWTTDEGLAGNTVRSLLADPQRGVLVYNTGKTNMLSRIRDGRVENILDLDDGPSYIANDGTLWVATTGRLQHVKDNTIETFGPNDDVPKYWVSAITEDDQSLILCVSTLGGVIRWKNGKASPYLLRDGTPFAVPFHVNSVYRSSTGILWFATYDGLWRVDHGDVVRYTTAADLAERKPWFDAHPQSSNYFHTVENRGMTDAWIMAICDDGQAGLWLASHRGGLAHLHDGQITSYTMKEGLPTNQVFGVAVDEDHGVWLSTPRGIVHIEAQEFDAVAEHRKEQLECRVFDTLDGMKSEECTNAYQPSFAKSKDGTIWFATRQGVVSVAPRHLPHNPIPPPVYMERVIVGGASLPLQETTSLAPGQTKYEFHYTALSLTVPERVRFRYRLDGFDRDWVDAGNQRAAYYTKLPPGHYRFEVSACNNDGVWNQTGAAYDFKVQPFFYETEWFYLACIAALAGVVFAGHRWRVRSLRAREIQLQQRVVERTNELLKANSELQREIGERERAEREKERIHSELMRASHQAGMAEIATGVLHNVGNVLNSVNVSTSLALSAVKASKIPNLSRLAKMLEENQGDLSRFLTEDPKGKLIPKYLQELSNTCTADHDVVLKELQTLSNYVEHINSIISMQQTYARSSGLAEPLHISELIEDALRINSASLSRHHVTVEKSIPASIPVALLEKHKVLQILVNLIRNAEKAVNESGRLDKRVSIEVSHRDGIIQIQVTDNGVGISPENLVKIFNHGFTTRKDGHGFGLHTGALAARELGGHLRAASEGIGKGATFTLEIPLHSPSAAAQTGTRAPMAVASASAAK